MDERSGPDTELLLTAAKLVLPVDDVEQLVLVGVDVQRRV